ncbi:porin [Reichenbachiella ulvae]|uniref:Porin n=1 Tax=Reichenbachiella ulvae TaxID=2980104 RepID=A0ABT3CWH6_9BACT|nr:porin [Reichenbachiella ulvae]MCV9387952.1 porin [Reichenbachiella ulvae]
MKNFTRVLLAALLVASFAATAQDEESPALSISGSVDAYYRVNLNGTNDERTGGTIAPGTSFANKTGFALGMANLIVGLDGEKTGFVADLAFGPRGTDAVFGSTTASSSIVNQLYAYWNVSDAVTLTVGNFNTFLGYEVISPTANFNYSTSYMFSYGPFSHSGLKADMAFGDFSVMLGVFNPTDLTDFNPTGRYLGGVQLGYGGVYLNFLFDDDFFQADLTAGWDLGESFYLGVNATTASDSFYGGALYLQNSFSDDFSLGLRGEYFSDQGVGAITFEENVIDLTLSANYSIGNLTIIPEIRTDIYSADEVIEDADGIDVSGDPINPTYGSNLSSFTIAAVYAF